ncbi:unnamed protein product [Durusdinium trenchii]|uniref:CS domain-containing protein n=1 Tax=Durusdinium trenchii TaxID=1381693 RepID=A0ABP0RAE3_9DINO
MLRALLGAALLASAVAQAVKGSRSPLIQALENAPAEDEARSILGPHLKDMKTLEKEVVELVVMRQWWTLARELVSKSHEQKVDLSFSVRKAVRSLKDEADELLRTLNPNYGMAQQVSPAFQWAQNDTSIFLTIKYTVRWNAPGALEVTDPSVNMTGNVFNFSGLGKHSNNKYKYFLSINLFDNIEAQLSNWNAASVGKLSVTLRKRWARKWPRLLSDKKTKVSNMHMWMEMQEKLDSSLSGFSSVSNSPITCAAGGKLYCVATDTCKKSENCSQCPGKTEANEEVHLCAGKPSEKASLTFQDADMDEHQLSGEVKIHKARNDFDVDTYAVFWGKSDTAKLENADGKELLLGEVSALGNDLDLMIPQNSPVPEGATHLLVFSRNAYGEYATPGSLLLRDAALPKAKPGGLTFEDEDGGKDLVRGRITISRAADEEKISEYSLHWGRSPTRKTSQNSFISAVRKEEGKDVSHWLSSQKPPEGATHLLAFSKNDFGEHPSPASFQIVDKTKACISQNEDSCPQGVQVTADEDPQPRQAKAKVTFTAAKSEEKIDKYRIFWGKQPCSNDVSSGAKNGHIRDVRKDDPPEVELAGPVPEGSSHILVFSNSPNLGESDFCVSTPFQDDQSAKSEKEL